MPLSFDEVNALLRLATKLTTLAETEEFAAEGRAPWHLYAAADEIRAVADNNKIAAAAGHAEKIRIAPEWLVNDRLKQALAGTEVAD